jgi:hypothetical protein
MGLRERCLIRCEGTGVGVGVGAAMKPNDDGGHCAGW